MKKDKNKAYKELDSQLKIHLESSINAVHIDVNAKDRIWDNLYNEIQEEKLKRKFTVRRTYRVAFVACMVLVLLVSLDLSSNASLFKKLLTSVSGNAIQFHTRDAKPYEENRNEELDNRVEEINESLGTKFISPALENSYEVKEIINNGTILSIVLLNNNNEKVEIIEKDVSKGSGTSVSYNEELFEIETLNSNGIEYIMLKSEQINMSLFVVGNVEFEIIGTNYLDILDIALSLQN